MTLTIPQAFELDIRAVPAHERFATVLRTLRSLPSQALDVIANVDPRALHAQFLAETPGRFSLNYLENGPERWRLRIRRRADTTCCGACGGV